MTYFRTTDRRRRENREIAEQLAISSGFTVLHMGVFDASGGFFLDHWTGFGDRAAEIAEPSGSGEISALTDGVRQALAEPQVKLVVPRPDPARRCDTRWLRAEPFLIGLGRPTGHLYPVIAARGLPALPEATVKNFLQVGMTFVVQQLGDMASQRSARRDHLLETALRVLSIHFAVVDAEGGIDYSANLTEDWLAEHGGFEIAGARLVARSMKAQKAFVAALSLATGPQRKSSIVSIRSDGDPVRLVWVSALEQSSPARALVILGRGGEDPAMRDHLLKLSGLTGAERRVAHHILSGRSLAETAEETNLALSTVRSYMKSILAKTSTHRQSEFISRYQSALSRMNMVSTAEEPLPH